MKGILEKIKEKVILRYAMTYVVVCVIVFMPLYSRGLSTVWKIDGVGQYYPGFLYIGQFIRDFFTTGKFTSFDIRIALGEDVFSALNYYGLGDPLNIIAVFSNKVNGPYLFAFMFYLRLFLAGLSFILYTKYMKLDEKLLVSGAFMYLCSGYVFAACLMYIEFLSPLIYFPLLLWSLEKFFKEGKWWWLTLVSMYAALCSMYLFYYAALFLVPYALIRALFVFRKSILKVIAECIMSAVSCVIGVILTFPVVFPALKGMLISERAGADVIGTLLKKTYYRPTADNILRFIKGFLPSYDNGEYFFHEIPITSYVAIALLLVVFFVMKKKSARNIQLLIAVVTGSVLYSIRITHIVFSGFVEGFSYDRWIFMLEFIYAICFVCVVSDLIADKFANDEKKKQLAYNIASSLALVSVVLIGFVYYSVAGKEFTNEFILAEELNKYVDSPVNYSKVISEDNGLYRISNDSLTGINERPENVAMINNYNGLTFWLSIVNPNTQKMADSLEKLNSEGFVDQRMFGLENSKVKESLAGVKYYLRHENEDFPQDYVLKEKIDFYGDDWEIYENPYALPLCYGYGKKFYNENLKEYYYNDNEEVISAAVPANNVIYENNRVTCEIELAENSVVLMSIPYSDGWSVTIDDEPATVYNSSIYYIGVDVAQGQHTLKYVYSAY